MIRLGKTERKLLENTLKAMDNAHVLWGYKVGTAVIAEDGKIYNGCNVESWVSGLGVYAERCAIDHAVLHGNSKILEIAVVTEAESLSNSKPCGACLQYIYDFSKDSETEIIMAQARKGKIMFETVEVRSIGELLPYPYRKRESLQLFSSWECS